MKPWVPVDPLPQQLSFERPQLPVLLVAKFPRGSDCWQPESAVNPLGVGVVVKLLSGAPTSGLRQALKNKKAIKMAMRAKHDVTR